MPRYEEPGPPTKLSTWFTTLISGAMILAGVVSMVTMDLLMPPTRNQRLLGRSAEHYVGWPAFFMGLAYVFAGLMCYFWMGGYGWEKWLDHRKRLVLGSFAGIVVSVVVAGCVK